MTINTKKVFEYWLRETGYSWDTAKTLFDNKKYPESLFFAHLAMEKILKAIVVVNTKQHAPYIHNLVSLIKKTGLPFEQKLVQDFKYFNDFCLSGRYDDYKLNFRKKCTGDYAKENFNKIKQYYLWLKKEAKKISPLK